MDEQTLSIILECPVCLNVLTESSKVLPCQHTFCRECLDDIVAKRGILHCPECRALITTAVCDLPRNILLMRLLSGIQAKRHSNTGLQPYLADCSASTSIDFSTKSCPTTPGYTAANFPLFFPQTHRKSLPNDDPRHQENVTSSRRIHNGLPRSPSALLHTVSDGNDSHNISLHSASSANSGLRTSRTTTDLANLANRYDGCDETSAVVLTTAESTVENRFFAVPAYAANNFESVPPEGTPLTSTPFTLSAWRISSHNRSFPVEKQSGYTGINGSRAGVRNLSTGDHSTSIHFRYNGRSDRTSGADQSAAHQSTLTAEQNDAGDVAVFNYPHSMLAVGTIDAASHQKDSRSFIKNFFRSHKNPDPSPKYKNSPGHDSGYKGSLGNEKPKTACLTTLRSTGNRPSKPVNFECYRCIAPYPARNHYELDLRLNDLLYVHQKHSDGWMKATHERTGRNGLIPTAFVERLHGSVTIT
ncbi:uncharacterized protein LOC129586531 [Paramacrobiotus metropolitanus]|uniref:uncharacterized protein LOC129586531 n=1 Tax=Paramacrobiotus metropolitanus TaxID=2943436 RepID=UPI00244659E4|nr:uncharacterized protein LOC129586531 [Paramacrobiotus metropolitanus]XP_055335796.1 uncharacterized protein LOC129586531 [Paramacrobiotus metropolitanus]